MLKTITDLYPGFYSLPDPQPPIPICVDGNPAMRETWDLLRLAELIGAHTVFEIGTYNGATALMLAEISTHPQVWTLDLGADIEPALPVTDSDRQWFGASVIPQPENVTLLYGDSATFDFAAYLGRCDLVFVMGAHSAEYIANDLAKAFELVSEQGLVVWHTGTADRVSILVETHDIFLMGNRMGVVKPVEVEVSSGATTSQDKNQH